MKLNGITLTKEQEKLWKFSKCSISCMICDTLIGYSDYNDIDAVCTECSNE
jgi:hypothetical protein